MSIGLNPSNIHIHILGLLSQHRIQRIILIAAARTYSSGYWALGTGVPSKRELSPIRGAIQLRHKNGGTTNRYVSILELLLGVRLLLSY